MAMKNCSICNSETPNYVDVKHEITDYTGKLVFDILICKISISLILIILIN